MKKNIFILKKLKNEIKVLIIDITLAIVLLELHRSISFYSMAQCFGYDTHSLFMKNAKYNLISSKTHHMM